MGEHTPFWVCSWGLFSVEHGFSSALLHCCLRPSHSWFHERGVHPQDLFRLFHQIAFKVRIYRAHLLSSILLMGIHDAFVTEYFITPDFRVFSSLPLVCGNFQFALGNGPIDQGIHELRLMEGFFLRRVDLQPEAIILYIKATD